MLSSIILRRVVPQTLARRQITTTAVRRSDDPLIGHINQTGQPGANLPFQIKNRYRLALVMVIYFGSAFTIPFFAVRHQLLKKNSA